MSYGAKRTNFLRDFRLARDQVEHLETASNLSAGRRQGIHHFFSIFSIFDLRDMTKH